MSDLDKVAAALWAAIWEACDPDDAWDEASDGNKKDARKWAKAAIDAHLDALQLTEETQTIPIFVDDVPRTMVWRGLEQVPAQHAEFIPHSHLKTAWFSTECPECAAERGVHDRQIAEARADAVSPWEEST